KAVFDALMTEAREYRAEYRVVLPSGEVRWLEARGQVDYAAGGQPVRMAGIILDITERKRAEEALRESEEWLRLAVKSSGAAVWQWDILKDEQVWSPESYKLHGRDPKLGPPDYEGWLHCLHPDDRASAEKAAFDAVEKRSPEYRMEYRVLLPSAEVRWLDEELLRAIIEHVPVPILVSREDRKILLVNPALTKLTGCTLADIPTRDEWEACAYRENGQRVKGEVHAIFERGVPVDRGEIRV